MAGDSCVWRENVDSPAVTETAEALTLSCHGESAYRPCNAERV